MGGWVGPPTDGRERQWMQPPTSHPAVSMSAVGIFSGEVLTSVLLVHGIVVKIHYTGLRLPQGLVPRSPMMSADFEFACFRVETAPANATIRKDNKFVFDFAL